MFMCWIKTKKEIWQNCTKNVFSHIHLYKKHQAAVLPKSYRDQDQELWGKQVQFSVFVVHVCLIFAFLEVPLGSVFGTSTTLKSSRDPMRWPEIHHLQPDQGHLSMSTSQITTSSFQWCINIHPLLYIAEGNTTGEGGLGSPNTPARNKWFKSRAEHLLLPICACVEYL